MAVAFHSYRFVLMTQVITDIESTRPAQVETLLNHRNVIVILK